MGSCVEFIRKKYYIFFVGLTNSLAFMCLGGALSWASPSMVKLRNDNSPIPIDSSQASWVGSLLAIGAVAVAVPYTVLFYRCGRRWIIIAIALFYLSGWLALIFANQVAHVYIGRFLLGAAVGPTYGIIPVYLAEVVGKTVRGAIVALLIVSQSMGALFQYGIGPVLSFHTHNTASIVFPLVFFILTLMMPESPYYLIGINKEKEAEIILKKLRGSDDIIEEFEDIKKCLKESPPMSYEILLKELPLDKTKKVIAIIAIATFAQQFSGVGAIIVYMETIFMDMNSPITPKNAVVIAEILSDCTLLITLSIIDRVGRKPLLLIASLVCIFAEVLVGIYFCMRDYNILDDSHSWIGLLGIFLIQIGYGMGLGSVPILVMSEVMSFSLKGWLSGFYQLVQGTYNAVSIKLFQILNDEVGRYCSYWIFAASILASVTYLMIYLPETKNKTLQEIQHLLSKKRRDRVNNDTISNNEL